VTVAIYLRGTAASRVRQSAECEAFAAAHYPGMPVKVYDDGESHGRRPELARLVSDLEAGTLTAAIVADTIRLMRPPELLYELAERAQCGALLHGVHGGDFDLSTVDGRIAVGMFAMAVAIRDAGGEP
jgi:DNA invertase Pin-like site-specific DNA recombinase